MVLIKNLPHTRPSKYVRGAFIKGTVLHSISQDTVEVPHRGLLVHLQFRRFAGCPVYNLHLHSFAKHHLALEEAGILEIIVFHSTKKELLKYAGGLPFQFIADPNKKLYRAYGVESSPRSLLNALVFFPILRAVAQSLWRFLAGKQPLPPLRPKGGSLGLPADFLIATDGTVIDCKYGRHADDQWSVQELLQLAGRVKERGFSDKCSV